MPHRYFTTEIADGTATLRGADAHHLARVMRGKLGDTVILCDGNAVEYTAVITGFGPETVEFSVEPGYPSAAEPSVFFRARIQHRIVSQKNPHDCKHTYQSYPEFSHCYSASVSVGLSAAFSTFLHPSRIALEEQVAWETVSMSSDIPFSMI